MLPVLGDLVTALAVYLSQKVRRSSEPSPVEMSCRLLYYVTRRQAI